MGTFGDRLRREREMRGVSLDEIAGATKIGTRLLRAVEDEHFELLPGGIFNKGFVRAYAKYLGIDEEVAVADYLVAAGHNDPDVRVIAAQSTSGRLERASLPVAKNPHQAGFPFIPVLILIVVIVGAAGGWQVYKERKADHKSPSPTPQSMASGNSGTPLPSPASDTKDNATAISPSAHKPIVNSPTANADTAVSRLETHPGKPASGLDATPSRSTSSAQTASVVSPSRATANESPATNSLMASASLGDPNAPPFEVMVRAKDRAWVSIKSDGRIMVRGIIKPPEIKTIRATDQVVFWTGNVGDVEVSFNGKNVPLSGGQNEERVLVFNARGLLPPQAAQ